MIPERLDIDSKDVAEQTIRHHLNRYKFVCERTTHAIYDPRCLDLGCGTGYGTYMLGCMSGGKSVGIDRDLESIVRNTIKFPKSLFLRTTIEDFIVNSQTMLEFDVITMFEVIEHLKYDSGVNVIRSIPKVLRPGGKFYLSTPRDINDKYNTFHISEWSYSDIKNICGSVFSKVCIYGQDWDTGDISEDSVRENDFFVAECTL